jgi:hypothetical protein
MEILIKPRSIVVSTLNFWLPLELSSSFPVLTLQGRSASGCGRVPDPLAFAVAWSMPDAIRRRSCDVFRGDVLAPFAPSAKPPGSGSAAWTIPTLIVGLRMFVLC